MVNVAIGVLVGMAIMSTVLTKIFCGALDTFLTIINEYEEMWRSIKVDHVELCSCSDHEPTGFDSVYYGMPILTPTKNGSYWEIKCPKCGLGGVCQHKSPQHALKWWNEIQEELKKRAV